MDRIARADADERRLIFETAAARLGITPAVIEKDFWVCYTLDHLFHRCSLSSVLTFKGGTSLSKAFHLIQRFSEDVDLILDWRAIGYGFDEPWEPRSNSAQERFKADAVSRTDGYLHEKFAPILAESLAESLGHEVSVRVGEEMETVWFDYPRTYDSPATLDSIKLEVGPMAAWSPSEEVVIEPYVAAVMRGNSASLSTSVRTVRPERTFWEKATILHQEAMRPEEKRMPRRYSRHYYDLYRLGNSPVLNAALDNVTLLARVVEFKEKFYRTPWARLSEAKPGSIRLVPPDYRLKELEADYRSMSPMLFGDYPALREIIRYLSGLEIKINA